MCKENRLLLGNGDENEFCCSMVLRPWFNDSVVSHMFYTVLRAPIHSLCIAIE